MRLYLRPAIAALPLSFAHSAYALDCGKASIQVEKLICATPDLKNADDAMSAAYFRLLGRTKDPDFHEALVRSQHRWIEARSHGVPRIDGEEEVESDDRKVLLKMTRDRLDFLIGDKPIHVMEQQRKSASAYSGGPFAGYEADGSCQFLPPRYGHWEYICWTITHRQHNDRICSVTSDWASGHMTEHRLVSVVTNGEARPVASCYAGYEGLNCPDTEDAAKDAHWNTNPHPSVYDLRPPRPGNLWKYDPDGPGGPDDPWMRECLFATTYPPPDVSRPDPTPKERHHRIRPAAGK